jgi:hypothetical protein
MAEARAGAPVADRIPPVSRACGIGGSLAGQYYRTNQYAYFGPVTISTNTINTLHLPLNWCPCKGTLKWSSFSLDSVTSLRTSKPISSLAGTPYIHLWRVRCAAIRHVSHELAVKTQRLFVAPLYLSRYSSHTPMTLPSSLVKLIDMTTSCRELWLGTT